MISRRAFLAAGSCIAAVPGAAWSRSDTFPAWLTGPAGDRLADRFSPPAGFRRRTLPATSFGAWLRQLPLRPPGEAVRYYDGRIRPDQGGVAAVVDIDIGNADLQQCADAIIRLRAEYLRATGRQADLAFQFTSGDRYAYADWLAGRRPRVVRNRVTWTSVGASADSRHGFRRWLDIVFMYAGTVSLRREMVPVRDARHVEAGDVLVQAGAPGHAVLVVDTAADAAGERRALLAQGFMPAQSIHVLNNPDGGAWYDLAAATRIVTPQWIFSPADLRRFA
jgi:hypothetical protein